MTQCVNACMLTLLRTNKPKTENGVCYACIAMWQTCMRMALIFGYRAAKSSPYKWVFGNVYISASCTTHCMILATDMISTHNIFSAWLKLISEKWSLGIVLFIARQSTQNVHPCIWCTSALINIMLLLCIGYFRCQRGKDNVDLKICWFNRHKSVFLFVINLIELSLASISP